MSATLSVEHFPQKLKQLEMEYGQLLEEYDNAKRQLKDSRLDVETARSSKSIQADENESLRAELSRVRHISTQYCSRPL